MLNKIETKTRSIIRSMGYDLVRHHAPVQFFHSDHYLRHTARRLEHLASLRIPVAGMSVLEVGAGIGDHSHYYLDRGCGLTITEARADNLDYLRRRYPDQRIEFLDMEAPAPIQGAPFDLVHCYGLLYHLSNPQQALAFLGQNTTKMLFLETCVSFGDGEATNAIAEAQAQPTQACSGTGCRPTRGWIFKQLQSHFEYVYLPMTQPCHEEFPLDWNAPEKHPADLQRSIFIASRTPLDNDQLTPRLVFQQTRHP
jgi:hypothetical protein